MADVSDVQDALVVAIDGARVASGATWAIARGFPLPAALEALTRAGGVMVTVFEREGYYRVTTRFPNVEHELPAVAPTLQMTNSGQVVTFSGACSPDQVAGIDAGGVQKAVRCRATDTPATMAAQFAALGIGRLAGTQLIVPRLVRLLVGRDVATVRPTRQQDVGLMVTVWSPDPAQRDTAARIIDGLLSDDDKRFLPLADGTAVWQRTSGSRQSDLAELATVYRQDLYFTCEFSTTIRAVRPVVLFPKATFSGG